MGGKSLGYIVMCMRLTHYYSVLIFIFLFFLSSSLQVTSQLMTALQYSCGRYLPPWTFFELQVYNVVMCRYYLQLKYGWLAGTKLL